ncbi:carboxypeptidase-like regulatory domain-containing protein [Desulfococcaceae bacterium HSG8]|nr:carboxypeptidase-like regulatory domain-containing protein [Desulfococcaceae bacterium HSG8]
MKKNLIMAALTAVFLFGLVSTGFPANPADIEISELEFKIKRSDDSVWFSKDPNDLDALIGTTWEFSYSEGGTEITDTVYFEPGISTTSNGSVRVGCFIESGTDAYSGGFYFADRVFMEGRGFRGIIYKDAVTCFYEFNMNGDLANGYYQSKSVSDGQFSDPYLMEGIKTADAEPICSVSGKITYKRTGKPIRNAKVKLKSETDKHVIKTDENGQYKFDEIICGTYKIKVTKKNHRSYKEERVAIEEDIVFDAELKHK